MKKSFISKGILWFFGHIVFSIGLSITVSEDFKQEIAKMIIQSSSPEALNKISPILLVVGIVMIVIGIAMIIPFIVAVCKKLPFLAHKTVKGAGKVLTKIGAHATNSVDRSKEDEGLERLQRAHGIIKDKDTKKSSGSSNSNNKNDDEYEYVPVEVSKSEVNNAMGRVIKSTSDSLAKVFLDNYDISENYDGTYDINIYMSYRLYSTYMIEDFSSHNASVEQLANEIIEDVSDKVGSLGCGFRIIPHIDANS